MIGFLERLFLKGHYKENITKGVFECIWGHILWRGEYKCEEFVLWYWEFQFQSRSGLELGYEYLDIFLGKE